MNKESLVDLVSEETGCTKKVVGTVLNSILSTIIKGLILDKKVTLVGFGTFENKTSKARVGHNPQNGDKIEIPERNVVRFSAGKLTKDSVNGETVSEDKE